MTAWKIYVVCIKINALIACGGTNACYEDLVDCAFDDDANWCFKREVCVKQRQRAFTYYTEDTDD